MTSRPPLQSTVNLPPKQPSVPPKRPEGNPSVVKPNSGSKPVPGIKPGSGSKPLPGVGVKPSSLNKPDSGSKPPVMVSKPASVAPSKPSQNSSKATNSTSAAIKSESKPTAPSSNTQTGSGLPKMGPNHRWKLEDFDIGRPLGKVTFQFIFIPNTFIDGYFSTILQLLT